MNTLLLRLLYELERPALQANDWAALRVSVTDLTARAGAELNLNPAEVAAQLRQGRREGLLLFLPDWERKLDQLCDGELAESGVMHEPAGARVSDPVWRDRPVFLPKSLDGWAVRSRAAEVIRLLGVNRERFGLEPSTAHLGYELQRRRKPDPNLPLTDVIAGLLPRINAGEFPAARADLLRTAVEVVGAALAAQLTAQGRASNVSGFQARTWEMVLGGLFGSPRPFDAATIAAGVSSGKTFAFLLPLLTLLVYRALAGEGRRCRALVLYPRTSLAIDQHHVAVNFVGQVNAQLTDRGLPTLSAAVALDAGQRLKFSLGVKQGALGEAIAAVAAQGVEVILTTAESLKNRLVDGRAVHTWLANAELVVVDEIHTLEGLAGCHGLYQLRRLRELMRQTRNEPTFEPFWVGASATVAEPVRHAARVFTVAESRVAHVTPDEQELTEFAVFHQAFVHTRPGKPGLSAVVNGLSCLVHNRNDGTAHAHYRHPEAEDPEPLSGDEIRKTIVFVDSLSTIGRLDFVTRDNERCHRASDTKLPYFGWFFRPAARLRASGEEVKRIEKQTGVKKSVEAVRKWCEDCWHGRPAVIDRRCFDADEYEHLCISVRMAEETRKQTTVPGFARTLGQLPDQVRNLDGCPFLEEGLCWHFSQDPGVRRPLPVLNDLEVYVDQARTVQYTSQTSGDEPDVDTGDVNDFFRRPAKDLWYARNQPLPATPVPTGVMIASPRIEVGVDFDRVRDGVTHKALRSAASFQQKVGRVGREPDSDSLIVTFLAQRSADAHFAHHPDRLTDPAHLDPIALKEDNADAIRTHLFIAALEYLAARRGLRDAGHLVDVIAPGARPDAHPPWEGKVRACLAHLRGERPAVIASMRRAVGHSGEVAWAIEALDRLEEIFELFLTDLRGVYLQGGTPARWFRENPADGPDLAPAFRQLIEAREAFETHDRQLPADLPGPLGAVVARLRTAALAGDPAAMVAAANEVPAAIMAAVAQGFPFDQGGAVFNLAAAAQRVAAGVGQLGLAVPLPRALEAHSVVRAFFFENNLPPNGRVTQQYYLHNVLATLSPFRRFYPYGLLRTHFQHIQLRDVQLWLAFRSGETAGRPQSEVLSVALFELLPGMWNYRYDGWPRKSPCGEIGLGAGDADQVQGREMYINLSRTEQVCRSRFEPAGEPLTGDDLPADLPRLGDEPVPVLRPAVLALEPCSHQPRVRAANCLVADGDESPPADEAGDAAGDDEGRFDLVRCPTLPRAFAAVWYRIPDPPEGEPVNAWVDNQPVSYPGLGRAVLESVRFTDRLTVTAYTYAIDRVYGNHVPGPRLYYRRGLPDARPAVLGDTLLRTDALRFRLNPGLLDAVLDEALGQPGALRGEVVLRAVRTFLSRFGGAGPFQSDTLRKAVAADWLDRGGDLDSFGVAEAVATLDRLDTDRYQALAGRLVEARFLGDDPDAYARSRERQTKWAEEAGEALGRARSRLADLTAGFVRQVGRDLLTHTLAVAGHDAVCRLVGAGDDELQYFPRAAAGEFYVFDAVEGGNGFTETAARFFHIPPQRRAAAAPGTVPSQDGFDLFAEATAACPAQAALRVVFESAARRAEVGETPPAAGDLRSRVEREYHPVTGARPVLAALLAVPAAQAVLGRFEDLLWVQVVPEWFALQVRNRDVVRGFSDFQTRVHGCITGCYECLDNGEGSVYGPVHSREHVSRGLLDDLRRRARLLEPGGFAAGPVTTTAPAGATLDPTLATGSLLTRAAGGWQVAVPTLAAVRDDREGG